VPQPLSPLEVPITTTERNQYNAAPRRRDAGSVVMRDREARRSQHIFEYDPVGPVRTATGAVEGHAWEPVGPVACRCLRSGCFGWCCPTINIGVLVNYHATPGEPVGLETTLGITALAASSEGRPRLLNRDGDRSTKLANQHSAEDPAAQ
jgi:hypothetical protein